MASKTFEYLFTANLHDIDAAGAMFFAHYFRHAHDAYETFMVKIGYGLPELIGNLSMLPLVRSEADFLLPAHHGEQLTINLQLERIGNTSFTVSYRFLNPRGQETAQLKTTHVMLNPEDGKPMTLPETLRNALTEYAA
ncbi:MAG: thioesterase family protein [Pseudomonadota bacterium]